MQCWSAGYGKEEETCVFELTYNYGQDHYDNFKGEGYGQVALSTEVSTCQCRCLPEAGCLSATALCMT